MNKELIVPKLSIGRIDFEKIAKDQYEDNPNNLNNLSYWFPKIKNCGFKVPDTCIINLPFKTWRWLRSDNYTQEKIKEFSDWIINYLRKENFDIDRNLFLKTGLYSDKFQFNNCKLTDINNIGEQFLNIFYQGMIVGADRTNEIVIREFIKSSPDKLTIYRGMPLNTEFRVFYDFDNKKILGVFNYWNKNVMLSSFNTDRTHYCEETLNEIKKDKKNFIKMICIIEKEFSEYEEFVKTEVIKNMSNVNMKGKWSIDIMKVEDQFYLIDMALANQSYYYEENEE